MVPHPHSAASGIVLGVDVGGTFTDAVLICDGRVFTAKELSTEPQSEGVLRATEAVLLAAGVVAADVGRFVHGMTVATNALLERRGADVVLVTTEGFAGILPVARQDRAALYTLHPSRPSPLVPDERCVTARERVGPGGVELPLTDAEVGRVVDAVVGLRPGAVAVCLLWSFLHSEHERMLAAALRSALPGVPVLTSSETAPVFREYERMSTTVVDAYVSPRTAVYLRDLRGRCAAAGLRGPEIMQSSGGTTDLDTAADHGARLLLSGPAGGVVAARLLGVRQGFSHILSFDMGGTSSDCAALVVEDREGGGAEGPGATVERTLAGMPVRLPMVDVHTVSAGGGSVAWVDPGGALKVGPRSAGAHPGPACYGLGGAEPTVTDALVVLGRIPARSSLAGTLRLDGDKARAIVADLGRRVGLTREQAAEGVVRIATANMAAALRAVTLERGLDPREFLLVAFGGAGGLHACDLADELDVRSVLVPLRAGVFSALGLCVAPHRADRTHTLLRPSVSLERAEWDRVWAELETAAARELAADGSDGVGGGVPAHLREVEARYGGQSYELTVLLERADGPEDVAERFHAAHGRRYGYRDPEAVVEVVALRAVVTRSGVGELPRDAVPSVVATGRVQAFIGGESVALPVWEVEAAAPPGDASSESHSAAASRGDGAASSGSGVQPGPIAGPALLAAREHTVFVAPGWSAVAVADGLLLGRRRDGAMDTRTGGGRPWAAGR